MVPQTSRGFTFSCVIVRLCEMEQHFCRVRLSYFVELEIIFQQYCRIFGFNCHLIAFTTHTFFCRQIHQLGHDTLVHLLENNANIPSLLHWVIDKCYTGAKLVVSGCFKALVSVFTKR